MDAIDELNKHLPPELHFSASDAPLTKPKMNKVLVEYARKYPKMYAQHIHKIGELGEELAYLEGHNMGLNELFLDNQKDIDKKLEKEDLKMRRMTNSQKKQHLVNVFDNIQLDVMKNKNNNLVNQAAAKARGNPATATRTAAGVVYAVDMNSEPYPFMIKNSLSKGLRAHEQYASGGQARYAAVQAAVSTSEPGAMTKVLIANTEHLKIGAKDCGTTNGIPLSTSGTDAVDRYEAKTNKLITPQYLTSLRKQGKKTIIARSPRTCQLKTGICAMCYGLNEKGKLSSVGHNVGIESSQAFGENSTQLILSAKHNVKGKAGTSNIPTGFQAAKIVLNSTETFPGKATISTTGGVVKSIHKLDTGGYNINVSGKDHFVGHDVVPKVAVGSNISKGDKLTNGIASTKDIMINRGVQEAREHLANSLYKYNDHKVDKRHFEVISRGYLDLVKPSSSKDVQHLFNYDSFTPTLSGTHELTMKTHDKQITKKYLAEPLLNFSKGRQIDSKIANALRKNGIKEAKVSHTPIPFTPVFKTYEQRPLANTSVWQSINYRGIKKGLLDTFLMKKEEKLDTIQSDRAKFALGNL